MKGKHFYFVFFILLLSLTSCSKNTKTPNISELRNISELAVLDCFYHTIAKKHKPADGIGKADKTVWYEFNVEMKLGIDTSKLSMDINENNITIGLPPIKEIGQPEILYDTINCVSSVDGLRKTTLTPEEKIQVVNDAKTDVINKINGGDPAIIKNAENRVRFIIESYIKRVGELSGTEYIITWQNLGEDFSINVPTETKEETSNNIQASSTEV